MSAKDCLIRLLETDVVYSDFKYCLVDSSKIPHRIDGNRGSSSNYDDFVTIDKIADVKDLDSWAGLGISIQASHIVAIDIDHCCTTPLDFSTADDRAKDIVNMFKDFAYIEFSFSGKGIRILYKGDEINPYKSLYYIKNSKTEVEYYQPSFDDVPSNRMVTITGNTIYDSDLNCEYSTKNATIEFLDKYMKRPKIESSRVVFDSKSTDFDYCMVQVKRWLIKDYGFQTDWFKKGIHPTLANPDESETDYRLIGFIYSHVTQDESMVKKLFEQSPFFKTKDGKHVFKWNYNDFRYFKWQFSQVRKMYGNDNTNR